MLIFTLYDVALSTGSQFNWTEKRAMSETRTFRGGFSGPKVRKGENICTWKVCKGMQSMRKHEKNTMKILKNKKLFRQVP